MASRFWSGLGPDTPACSSADAPQIVARHLIVLLMRLWMRVAALAPRSKCSLNAVVAASDGQLRLSAILFYLPGLSRHNSQFMCPRAQLPCKTVIARTVDLPSRFHRLQPLVCSPAGSHAHASAHAHAHAASPVSRCPMLAATAAAIASAPAGVATGAGAGAGAVAVTPLAAGTGDVAVAAPSIPTVRSASGSVMADYARTGPSGGPAFTAAQVAAATPGFPAAVPAAALGAVGAHACSPAAATLPIILPVDGADVSSRRAEVAVHGASLPAPAWGDPAVNAAILQVRCCCRHQLHAHEHRHCAAPVANHRADAWRPSSGTLLHLRCRMLQMQQTQLMPSRSYLFCSTPSS